MTTKRNTEPMMSGLPITKVVECQKRVIAEQEKEIYDLEKRLEKAAAFNKKISTKLVETLSVSENV
jgi:hypothetical protein